MQQADENFPKKKDTQDKFRRALPITSYNSIPLQLYHLFTVQDIKARSSCNFSQWTDSGLPAGQG